MRIESHDALLIVDVQNDFLPGGSLAVPHGDEVIPALNRYIRRFEDLGRVIAASRDWHPTDHCSFREHGGPWPVHCVVGTMGAQFAPALALPLSTIIVSKGTQPDCDAYSAFQDTDLHEHLQREGVTRLFIGGLATDYCVRETVRDARAHGYAVVLLTDAIRAVNVHLEDGRKAEVAMQQQGAVPLRYEELRDND